MTAVLQENLTGIRVVRAFAQQERETQRFGRRIRAFRDNHVRLARLMGLYYGAADLLALGQLGIVLVAGARFILDGRITVGDLFAFLTVVGMVTWPIRTLGRVLTDTGKAVVALGRIDHILTTPEESPGATPSLPRARGAIRVEHLQFWYTEERPVLRDLSFHIEAGETVGLVGAPGSGKSSLIRVLLRPLPVPGRPGVPRRPGAARRGPQVAAQPVRRRPAGPLPVLADHRGEPAGGPPGRAFRGLGGGVPGRRGTQRHRRVPGRLRGDGGGTGRHAVRRPAPARRPRPGPRQEPAGARPGRLALRGGHGHRAAHPGRPRPPPRPAHHHRRRPPALHRRAHGPHPRAGPRAAGPRGHPRRPSPANSVPTADCARYRAHWRPPSKPTCARPPRPGAEVTGGSGPAA